MERSNVTKHKPSLAARGAKSEMRMLKDVIKGNSDVREILGAMKAKDRRHALNRTIRIAKKRVAQVLDDSTGAVNTPESQMKAALQNSLFARLGIKRDEPKKILDFLDNGDTGQRTLLAAAGSESGDNNDHGTPDDEMELLEDSVDDGGSSIVVPPIPREARVTHVDFGLAHAEPGNLGKEVGPAEVKPDPMFYPPRGYTPSPIKPDDAIIDMEPVRGEGGKMSFGIVRDIKEGSNKKRSRDLRIGNLMTKARTAISELIPKIELPKMPTFKMPKLAMPKFFRRKVNVPPESSIATHEIMVPNLRGGSLRNKIMLAAGLMIASVGGYYGVRNNISSGNNANNAAVTTKTGTATPSAPVIKDHDIQRVSGTSAATAKPEPVAIATSPATRTTEPAPTPAEREAPAPSPAPKPTPKPEKLPGWHPRADLRSVDSYYKKYAQSHLGRGEFVDIVNMRPETYGLLSSDELAKINYEIQIPTSREQKKLVREGENSKKWQLGTILDEALQKVGVDDAQRRKKEVAMIEYHIASNSVVTKDKSERIQINHLGSGSIVRIQDGNLEITTRGGAIKKVSLRASSAT